MSRKRTIQKNIRLSSEEAEKLSSFANKAGISEGEYIRRLIADPKHVFTDETNNLYRLYREYKRQGVLLGKIAHVIEDGS
ncbi:MAG: hypothetical protein Q4D34_03970, partial [Eggerthellaceae bacterium]|nr:hypothetical protein [Eggerthellaceae bacterium]